MVALYPREKRNDPNMQDYRQAVADLLDEYKRKGKNIQVDMIDPEDEPTRVDQVIKDVERMYEGVQGYRDLLAEFPKTREAIRKFADEELEKQKGLSFDQIRDESLGQTMQLAEWTLQGF